MTILVPSTQPDPEDLAVAKSMYWQCSPSSTIDCRDILPLFIPFFFRCFLRFLDLFLLFIFLLLLFASLRTRSWASLWTWNSSITCWAASTWLTWANVCDSFSSVKKPPSVLAWRINKLINKQKHINMMLPSSPLWILVTDFSVYNLSPGHIQHRCFHNSNHINDCHKNN